MARLVPSVGLDVRGGLAIAVMTGIFGQVDGQPVDVFTLRNARGLVARITNYGATLLELQVPDRSGRFADVVLGFDRLEEYRAGSPYFGSTVGRVGNRIRNSQFELGERTYRLAANDGAHHLHGGVRAWDKRVWKAEPISTNANGQTLKLSLPSPAGEEGYPGHLDVTTTYALTDSDELRIEMTATAGDDATIINMVHHSYWNLGGHSSGTVLDHDLTLDADEYTPGDPTVPTGVVAPVRGTALDFTTAKAVGRDLAEAGAHPIGYDHNFVVRGEPNRVRPVARVKDPKSGRVMTVEANQPGVQFYSGNYLDGSLRGKGGATYVQHAGLCLETQCFPNAINVPAWRDQVILRRGQTYHHIMVHRFTSE